MAKDLSISVLLDFYGAMLTDKQREVTHLYYNEDLSLAEIAVHSGITRQGVRDSIKRAEFTLTDCEYKLGLYARFQQQQEKLNQIIRLANDIDRYNDRYVSSAELGAMTRQIVRLADNISDEE